MTTSLFRLTSVSLIVVCVVSHAFAQSEIGIITVNGDYTQGPNGTLDIQIAGTGGAGNLNGHDQLAATQTASLDGTLKLTNVDGFNPAVGSPEGVNGDEFMILTSPDGRSGTFSAVPGRHMGTGKFYEVNYNMSDVTLGAFQALAGDADGDKDIDITDFNILAVNFDTANIEWMDGNFDDNNDIDITDFNFLAANFAPTGYGAAGPSSVPEPAAIALVIFGFSCLAYVTRFRR